MYSLEIDVNGLREELKVKVSPSDTILIASDTENSDWLDVYIFNNSDEEIKNIKLTVNFPKEVNYYKESTWNKSNTGTCSVSPIEIKPKSFKEIRFLPICNGKEKRLKGTIRIEVDTPYGIYEYNVVADMAK